MLTIDTLNVTACQYDWYSTLFFYCEVTKSIFFGIRRYIINFLHPSFISASLNRCRMLQFFVFNLQVLAINVGIRKFYFCQYRREDKKYCSFQVESWGSYPVVVSRKLFVFRVASRFSFISRGCPSKLLSKRRPRIRKLLFCNNLLYRGCTRLAISVRNVVGDLDNTLLLD